MSAPGAPGTAGGAAGPSTACGDSPLGPEALASLFSDPFSLIGEDQAAALLEKLVGEDEPRVAGVKRLLLQDEEACGDTLGALQVLSLVPSDRWGEAVAAHRCSTSGGCLSHLAKASPALLDELRALLVEAAEAAAATKEREAVMPVRTAVKVRRRMWAMGKVSSSPAMEQALAATASLPTDLPPSTPAEAGTEVWRALQSRGVYVKGCRDFCKGYVGSSNDFGYRQSARSGGPSRAAGVDIKRRGDNLMSPEEVVNRRCCVYLWKLLEAVCEQTGAPLSKPVLAERADAKDSYQAFQVEILKARRGAAASARARGGPALEALLADDAACGQLLQRLQTM